MAVHPLRSATAPRVKRQKEPSDVASFPIDPRPRVPARAACGRAGVYSLLLSSVVVVSILILGTGCSETLTRSYMPLFAHPGSCGQCHGSSRDRPPDGWKKPQAPQDAVCTTAGCHSRLDGGGAHIHGPVAIGACSSCHVPHSSTQPHLLTRDGGELCSHCHSRLRSCPKATEPSDSRCSSCHDAHRADNSYFLRSESHPLPAHGLADPLRARGPDLGPH